MVEYSEKELEEQKKMTEEFEEQWRSVRINIRKGLTKEQKTFLKELEEWSIWYSIPENPLTMKLYQGLKDGTYKKPSEFFEGEMQWIFEGIILPNAKKYVLYAMDNCIKWQYSHSYFRRSFQTADYSIHIKYILQVVLDFMRIRPHINDICTWKKGNFSVKEFAFSSPTICNYPEMLMYELDHENEQLEEYLTDIIMGEGEEAFSRKIIIGIVRSENAKMHELLCKLLVAARLQEGLRQAICENADAGTIPAFLAIIKTVEENGLIRFSSVKRAVGTWLGFINDETGKLERISSKSIEYIVECLEHPASREEFLASEDSMKIYIALWSYGLYEAKDAIERCFTISKEGTKHQILTAGYFVENLNNEEFSHSLAKEIIAEHKGDWEILAVYLPYFMKWWYNNWFRAEDGTKHLQNLYYKDKEEMEQYYDILLEMYQKCPKKKLEFSPCIFPWHSAVFTISNVAVRLCITAFLLQDMEKIDAACTLIKECDASDRWQCLKIVLEHPKTSKQREVLTEALSNRDSYTRGIAYKIVENTTLEQSNYLQIEDMLKYKAADMRANLITLLYKQEDEALYGSIERLISDKKEEKRTAALDLIMQLSKDEARSSLFEKTKVLAESITEATTKESILLGNILGSDIKQSGQSEEDLYQEGDQYIPVLSENAYVKSAIETYMSYFPDSKLAEQLHAECVFDRTDEECETMKQAKADCQALSAFIELHKDDEFVNYRGETCVVGGNIYSFHERLEDNSSQIPFLSMWKEWYEEHIASKERLLRAMVFVQAYYAISRYTEQTEKYICTLYGDGYQKYKKYSFPQHLHCILEGLGWIYIPAEDWKKLAVAQGQWYVTCVPDEDVLIRQKQSDDEENEKEDYSEYGKYAHLITHAQIGFLFERLVWHNDDLFEVVFPIAVATGQKSFAKTKYRSVLDPDVCRMTVADSYSHFYPPRFRAYIIAAFRGFISKEAMYCYLFDEQNIAEVLEGLSAIVSFLRDYEDQKEAEKQGLSWKYHRSKNEVNALVEKEKDFTAEDEKLLKFAEEIYENIMEVVLSVELKRGDSETKYSKYIRRIGRIYGMERFIAILSAMGKETLERSSYADTKTKKGSLSHLLRVCLPKKEDNAKMLKTMVKGTDITDKRLIEAALYSDEWIDIVAEYLGWDSFKSGCYYFMAHMNEWFDSRKEAMFAKYTPLTPEELNVGAFDVKWFWSAYEGLGEKRFQMLYTAAKYISDGSKHSRARKYADAVLGKLDIDETEALILDKRNKDLLMAYTLIPLKDEEDICRRYLFLQEFLKKSKTFGSQRSASEKKAVETAMTNLATNAGYADVLRLTLRMETKLIDDSRELFEEKEIEDVTVKLVVSEDGKTDIVCMKGEKKLKSVPARLKKNPYIVSIKQTKKNLTEQYRRTKVMFEQAMEDGTEFTVGELAILRQNPVALPIIKDLVFVCDKEIGFLEDTQLIDVDGKVTQLKEEQNVIVAHPFHLYESGQWTAYQKNLFERKVVQPFKQVFRELYVKTEEEKGMQYSLRYSGNQIQPAKTVACLKSRRWLADIEDGLQKVYYEENIVATIYAMADWFSPADIEAPTLEKVVFYHRQTGKALTIESIPDVIFSEVMRDVDLAVSVAHAGGVDPETSHSTVEMRAALLEFTLPLFKLSNVTIQGSHAMVEGKYGSYTIHLGSGVIHKQGGIMISVLPVHSQHRGKLFLPFADDDPKTAEIMTKVIFFAEDHKIKDPSILEQIR